MAVTTTRIVAMLECRNNKAIEPIDVERSRQWEKELNIILRWMVVYPIEIGTLGAKDYKCNDPNCKCKDNKFWWVMLSLGCLCKVPIGNFQYTVRKMFVDQHCESLVHANDTKFRPWGLRWSLKVSRLRHLPFLPTTSRPSGTKPFLKHFY